jgi:Tfp pilus assembly protein PilO
VNRLTRTLIAIVACGGAVYGYWKVDVAPKRAEAAKLEQEVATQEAQLAQTQALIGTYEGARAAYKDNYSKVVRLGKAIPSDDDTKSLVVQLDAAAKRSNVDFDTLNVNGSGTPTANGATPLAPGAINAGAFAAMPFALSFTGDFQTLGNFLARLERFVSLKGEEIAVSGRLMRVEKLQLLPGPEGWPDLSAQIGASSYIVPETEAVADPGAAGGTTAATGTTTTTADTGTPTTTAATGTDIR